MCGDFLEPSKNTIKSCKIHWDLHWADNKSSGMQAGDSWRKLTNDIVCVPLHGDRQMP